MSRSSIFGFVFSLVFAFVALPVFAYVSPGLPTGYVNDFADVLSSETETLLNTELETFTKETGGEVAVAVVPSLGGDDIESYANTLFREWGVGGEEENNGILLLVAIEDRDVRIEVGYGYEGVVPDAYASRIIRDDVLPSFREGDYDGGIKNGVTSLLMLIRDPSAVPPVEERQFNFEDLGIFAYLVFFVGAWLVSIMSRTKDWWLGGVFGGVGAGIVALFVGVTAGLISAIPLIIAGLIIDFAVSSAYRDARSSGVTPPWWTGGGGSWGGSSGGSFGGFGGGSSGGGGASGSW